MKEPLNIEPLREERILSHKTAWDIITLQARGASNNHDIDKFTS